jgi:hypothetical protein
LKEDGIGHADESRCAGRLFTNLSREQEDELRTAFGE